MLRWTHVASSVAAAVTASGDGPRLLAQEKVEEPTVEEL
jgi:hypothetical protein